MTDGASDPADQIEFVITGPKRAAASTLWRPIGAVGVRSVGSGPAARYEGPSTAIPRGRGVNLAS